MANTSQEALADLQATQAAAQNPNDILSAQRQQFGVGDAQNTLTGLRGAVDSTTKLLKSVAPSVMGRTASSLVTNAQAGKQIQNEQAPINQSLSEQGEAYNRGNEDLTKKQQQAAEAASGIYQGQQDKMSYLQNIYSNLFQKEQAAEAAKQAEANRQEQIRQFNEQLGASNRAAAGSGGGFSLGGLGGNSGSPAMSQRGDKGFNFQGSGGQSISAATYAQLTGQSFRSVLQKMASAGDAGAKAALGFVGDDFGYNKSKIGNNQAIYNNLVWGSGKKA